MRKKHLLEYIVLGIFIFCMALSLSAALEYNTVATNREYLNQGLWVICILVGTLLLLGAMRLEQKIAPRLSKRTKTVLLLTAWLALFFAGLVLRLKVIWNFPVKPASDYETYYNLGIFLQEDTLLTPAADLYRRYVTLYPHTIGFPMLFLKPAFDTFGASVHTALYTNLVCSMIAVLLTGHIGWRCGGALCGVMALGAASLWPSHVLYSSMVATEQSYTMLLLISLELVLTLLDRSEKSAFWRSPNRALFCLPCLGIALGVAAAVRPVALIVLAAYGVMQIATANDLPENHPLTGPQFLLRRGWICLLVVLAFYQITGKLVGMNISNLILEEPASGLMASGYNMMVGLNCESQGLWNQEDADFFTQQYDETGSANAAHAACMQVAIERAYQEPENVLNLMVYKFRDMWRTDDFGLDWNLLWLEQQGQLTPARKTALEAWRQPGRALWLWVLFYALLGAAQAWRQTRPPKPQQLLFILIFCGTALSQMLLETQVRYHYNIVPILILLASMTVVQWRQRIADEPPVKVVVEQVQLPPEYVDHTKFDMAKALREGHVHLSISQAVAEDAIKNQAAPEEASAPEEVPTLEEAPASEETPAHQPEPAMQ